MIILILISSEYNINIEKNLKYDTIEQVITMDMFTNLVHTLKQKKYHITSAESCTAGMFCSHLADVSGASDVLAYGFVVYSAEAKCDMLGVNPETIAAYGVVSEETAREMVSGAVCRSGAEIGVSFTGYAGPGVDPEIGKVCFGFFIPGHLTSKTVMFGNIGRNTVREKAAAFAAAELLKLLEAESC